MKKINLRFLLSIMGIFTLILFSCNSSKFSASDFLSATKPKVKIIPKPVSLQQQDSSFELTQNARIILLADSLKNSADYLNDYLKKYYGFTLKVMKGQQKDTSAYNAIVLGNGSLSEPISGGYTFDCSGNNILIRGKDARGTFYGIQTLIQLLPADTTQALDIAHVRVKDYPRFKYRGMMLDCGRHFFPPSFVKKYIDYLALHKMDVFHWHLTEDQGWRIQIKKYPKLTKIGSTREPTEGDHNYSGYYTQDQIKEIVKYAQKRYITIIPEIEIPGHSLAAIAAYPRLTCDTTGDYKVANTWGVFSPVLCPKPYTFKFYENVLDEVMDLFPSHYIHIGGDEAPTDTWENSAYCKKLMKEKGLTDVRQIQGYFTKKMGDYLGQHGRTMIGWDEILEGGVPSDAVVMSWRGTSGGIKAAHMNHDVIMSPSTYLYFDMQQQDHPDSTGQDWAGTVNLKKVYDYNPTKGMKDSVAQYLLGVQANIWTEMLQWPTSVEYKMFPRIEALSEIAWTPNEEKNYSDFKNRLSNAYERYQLWGVSYFKGEE